MIHPGHLSCLAADKSAARFNAPLCDAFDNLSRYRDIQLATRKVVKEVQGLSPLYDEIVHRHGDEVDTYYQTFFQKKI